MKEDEKMNLWKYSGWYLVAIGIIHNTVGTVLGWQLLTDIFKDGVIYAIKLDYGRNFVFWFLFIGFFWIFIGFHWQSLMRKYQEPLSPMIGWGLTIFTLVSLPIIPTSGMWLFIPLCIILLLPHYKKKSEAITMKN